MNKMNQLLSEQPLKKRSFFYIGGLAMIFLLALSSIFSPIRALSYFNQIWAICIIGWFFFTFLENPYFLLKPSRHRFAIYLYLIYTIGVAYMVGNGSIGNRFFELSQLLLFYMAYEKNKLSGRNQDNLFIIKLISPFVLITCYITIMAYSIDPFISRSIRASQGEGIEYLKMGVGGYEFIYFLVILVPILIFVLFNRNRSISKRYKFLGIGATGLFGVNIVLSNFSTAFFLLLLGIIIRLFFYRFKYSYVFIYVLLLLLIMISFQPLITFILDFLADNLGDSNNVSRVIEIKDLLINGESGTSIEARNDVFLESIYLFFENPIFGIITEPINRNSHGQIIGFGQHSQVLDTFALYGLFIGLLQLYVYLNPLFARLKYSRGIVSGFTLAIMIVFLFIITINNTTPSVGFAVFFIFPTMYDWYIEKNFKN
jgi:hypothetical protein